MAEGLNLVIDHEEHDEATKEVEIGMGKYGPEITTVNKLTFLQSFESNFLLSKTLFSLVL